MLPCHKRSRERLFIPQETNFTTLKYKGNFWSRMKGRDDERTSVTPGPGNYEHETKKSPAQIHEKKTREAKRATVKQPRFLEALYQQKLRQVILRACFVTFPAAGSFTKIQKITFVSVNYLIKICFSPKNFPAPNYYDPPKSVFDKYKYISCKCDPYKVEPPPFNQTARV